MNSFAQLLEVDACLRRTHYAVLFLRFDKDVSQIVGAVRKEAMLKLIDIRRRSHRQLKQNTMSKRNQKRNLSRSNSFSSIDSDLLQDYRRPSRSRSRWTNLEHSPAANARRLIVQKNSLVEQNKLMQIQVMELKTQLNQLTAQLQENNKQRKMLQLQLQERQSNLRKKQGQILQCTTRVERDKQELETVHRLLRQLNQRLKHLQKQAINYQEAARQWELKFTAQSLQTNKASQGKRLAQKQLKVFKAEAQAKIHSLQKRITEVFKNSNENFHRRNNYSTERPKKMSIDLQKGQSDALRWVYKLGTPQEAEVICRSLVKFSESFVDMVEKLSGESMSPGDNFSKRLSKSWKYLKQFLVQRL